MRRGDRVAALLWNHARHLEAYFGVPAAGCVNHTLNLRLHPDELAYIARHAGDRILLIDDVLLPLYEKLRERVEFERVIVAPTTGAAVPAGYESHEDFLATGAVDYRFPFPMAAVEESVDASLGKDSLKFGVVANVGTVSR